MAQAEGRRGLSHRPAAAAGALLALGACASLPSPTPPQWRLQVSATTGAALSLTDARGEILRLACRRSPSQLYLAADRLAPAHGPVRLEVDGHSFELQALAEASHLAAVAPVPDALPAALMAGGEIRLTAGDARLGPLAGPDARAAAAFVIACRASAR